MSIEQMFAGMDRAAMFGNGQYFSPGRFRVKTKSLKVNNGFKGVCFIAELEVISSDQKKDAEGNQADPPGCTRSWVVKMGTTNRNAFGDIKGFMFALLGHDPKRVPPPEVAAALHAEATESVKMACDAAYAQSKGFPSDAFEGIELNLEAFHKATKPSAEKPQGGTFTVHNWTPVAAEGQAA